MTGVSTLAQALAQLERIKTMQLRFSDLSTQLATGRKTQEFSGLGKDVLNSQRARADFKTLETYINNAVNADRRINLMTTAIKEFRQQAENFAAALVGFSQQSAHQQGEIVYYDDPITPEIENIPLGHESAAPDVDLETLQDLAGNIYSFLTSLINEQDGDRYLFAGAENLTRPLTDTGSLDSAISSLLNDWRGGALSNAELIDGLNNRDASLDPNAIVDSIIGYSPALSSSNARNVFVRIDDTAEVDYTVLANDQAFRDILVALSYFKSGDLGPIADEVDPATLAVTTEGAPGADLNEMKENFYEVFNAMARTVNQALDRMEHLESTLENARVQITKTKQNHERHQAILENVIGDIEHANMDEVAVSMNALQIQLDASYRITARLQELSLVNFI